MFIITNNGQFDTEKDAVVLTFKDDDELNGFLAKIATIQVKTSGVRVLSLIPENTKINPLQRAILDIITGLDGIGCNDEKEHRKIADENIDKLQNIIDTYGK